MIDNKNNWYYEAKSSSRMIQEAGMSDFLQKAILAVSLVLVGCSVPEAAHRTGLTFEQVSQALKNKEIVEQVKGKNKDNSKLPISQIVDDNSTQGFSTELDMDAIENLIRLNEVSGAKTFVTIGGKKVDIRKAYPDPVHGWKVPTIGVGFNLNRSEAKSLINSFGLNYEDVRSGKQSLTEEQVDILYRNDIQNAIKDAKIFLPSFDKQPTQVKTVLVDMSFNMGLTRLSTFKNFKEALENALETGDYSKAIMEMRNSNWAKQTKSRADRSVKIMIEVMKEMPSNQKQTDKNKEQKPTLFN